ncbi:MAG TPA: hypothetical protein VGM92_09980 [Candidatus Kapabacteria bacterium]|jgi:hypothetical protein
MRVPSLPTGLSNAKGRYLMSFFSAIAISFALASCHSSSTNPPSSGGSGIGPDGGTVTSADGKVTLVIPAGALSSNQTIAISTKTDSNTCPQASGPEYDLTPNGLTFSKPVMLTLNYDSTLPGSTAEIIGVASQEDTGGWYGWTGGTVDTVHQTVTVPITHFSSASAYVPYAITPSQDVVFTGESLAFEVNATGAPAVDAAGNPVELNPFAPLIATWQVSGGGTIDNPGPTSIVNYTAPAEMPSPNVVTLAAKVPGLGSQTFLILAFIHVVSKNWKMSVTDSMIWSCPSIITYTYVSGGYLDFEISPSGDHEITGYSWFADPTGLYNESLCPQLAPLVASHKLTLGSDTKLNGITGNYDPASNRFHFSLDETYRNLPGWDVTFTTGETSHQDLADGNEYTWPSPFSTPMQTQSYLDDHSSGAYFEHTTFTLTAQP